jgi:intraflagellar transport protein 140
MLNESRLHSQLCGDTAVAQASSHEVAVLIGGSPHPLTVNADLTIRGLFVGRSCFVVWSGKAARIYRVDLQLQKVEALNVMQCSGKTMAIADASSITEEAWFTAESGSNSIKICNFAGTQKGMVTFSEAEGHPEHIDINGKFLAVVSGKGSVKVFDVHAPTKPKLLGSVGQLFASKPVMCSGSTDPVVAVVSEDDTKAGVPFGTNIKIRSIKVNSSGTRVAVLTDTVEGALKICHPDARLFIYDRSKGVTWAYDLSLWKRSPISVFWDDVDDRLLACEAVKTRSTNNSATRANTSLSGNVEHDNESDKAEGKEADLKKNANLGVLGTSTAAAHDEASEEAEIEVYLFFATTEHGILLQDSFGRKHPYGSMVALSVPRLYFRNIISTGKNEDDEETNGDHRHHNGASDVKLFSKVMRDFVGMDDVNEAAKIALLDFSYNLTLGRLDEAYKAVKAIDSPSIWENMAQMCVKTKRLDVAEVCLGNMGHARGAAALRASRQSEGDALEVTVGTLAVQLGLLDDAARLFREANRYDKLNKLYQAAGLWEKAINTAVTKDRIHMKTTHFQYAKHLESLGRVDDAVQHYELSENSRTEVPRMLFHLGRVEELGEYVMKSDDAALLKWWAAYLESIERYDKAMKYYNKAKDYLSLVRICCFKVGG